jgi:hypothetical protein
MPRIMVTVVDPMLRNAMSLSLRQRLDTGM